MTEAPPALLHFLKPFTPFTPLSTNTLQAFAACLTSQRLPAGTQLLQRGQICTRAYLLETGLVRAGYRHDEKETDVTAWFAKEGQIFFSRRSFFTQQPAQETIELLEDSQLLFITYDDLENLYNRFPDMNRLGRLISHHYTLVLEERLRLLQHTTARQRLERFVAQSKDLYQRVPMHHLATYLGVAPETLSRARAQK